MSTFHFRFGDDLCFTCKDLLAEFSHPRWWLSNSVANNAPRAGSTDKRKRTPSDGGVLNF
jgi:hypothetical protein